MSKLRRYFRPGDWVFLTFVTYQRRPILIDFAVDLLDVLNLQCRKAKVELLAWVILPDHVHLLLDSGDADVSLLMRRVKLAFSARYRTARGVTCGRLWQLRFYDHIIRDDDDLNRHIDYVHFNPVRHGYAKDPSEWEWSSMRSYLERGQYEPDWRVVERDEGRFGE